MRVTFLGTGTSVGIPAIGCNCKVCVSTDPRNRRRRSSIYVEAGAARLLVDTPPDFREQALAYRIPRVDAVLFTHSHADHIFGFDDIRRFNTIQECVIPAYGAPSVIADLKRVFNYIGTEKVPGLYRPRIEFCSVDAAFAVGGADVLPLPVIHGSKPTYGYRVTADGCSVGYVPDCHVMPDEVIERVRGVDVMILNALRNRPHSTHMTVEESLALLAKIGAKQSYLIHMSHDLDHAETQARLRPGVQVSHDGLVLEW